MFAKRASVVFVMGSMLCHVDGASSLPNMQTGEAIAELLKSDLTGKSEAFSSAFQDVIASKQ